MARRISLKGKAFVSHGRIHFGDSFSYDPETGRLYKRVGDETIPQFDVGKSPPFPSFVETIFVPDLSYDPDPAVVELRKARERWHTAGFAYEAARERFKAAEERLREIDDEPLPFGP